MSARAPKTNPMQWAVLVEFLMEHPEMVTKTFVGMDARQKYKNLWEQTAKQLNSIRFGSKTCEKWIEAFSKWKSKIKVKAQNIRLNMNQTGGGEPLPPLTPIEENLMGIIGWAVVEGDSTTELGFENNDVCVQTETPRVVNCIVEKIPALVPISSTRIPSTEILATPSTSALEETKKTANGNNSIETHKRKSGIELKNKTLGKRRRRGDGTTRKRDKMILLRMHQENMAVLQEISTNLAKLADNQKEFPDKINFITQN